MMASFYCYSLWYHYQHPFDNHSEVQIQKAPICILLLTIHFSAAVQLIILISMKSARILQGLSFLLVVIRRHGANRLLCISQIGTPSLHLCLPCLFRLIALRTTKHTRVGLRERSTNVASAEFINFR